MTTKLVSKWTKPGDLGGSVPRATTYGEMNSLVFSMVAYLGPYAACDPVLLVKLIRLGKQYMAKVIKLFKSFKKLHGGCITALFK